MRKLGGLKDGAHEFNPKRLCLIALRGRKGDDGRTF